MPKRKRESKTRSPKVVPFPDAIQLAIQNLQSEDFKSREDAQTTLGSLDLIIELNRRGLLTYDSQEGAIDQKYNIRERAYVLGFMMREHAQKLMQNVMVHSDKVFFIQPIDKTNKMNAPQYFRPERVPLTVTADRPAETTQSLTIPSKIFDWQRKLVHIKPHKDLVTVFAFDPIWGRLANSSDGLWNTLLAAI
jgi:hypothetical protein